MSKIEEIIKNNLESFNNAEPADEHFENFSKKLSRFNKPKKQFFNRSMILKVAATILILISISIVASYLSINKEGLLLGSQSNAALPEELQEVELYYASLTDEKIKEIESLAASPNQAKELKSMALKEVEEIESTNQELQEEYVNRGKNEKLLNAIANNYRIISKLLDHIIDDLNKQNNQESMNLNENRNENIV